MSSRTYAARVGLPTTPLIATGPFGATLSAQRAGAAIARGLRAGGRQTPDICAIPSDEERSGEVQALLDELDFDARMRPARAVILGQWRLHERTLAGSAAFEIATRARQAGVPAYAVTGENGLDSFDARILDLQTILEASSARALAAAGRTLAQLV
jgi:glycerate kinase